MKIFALALLSISLSVAAQFCLKAGMMVAARNELTTQLDFSKALSVLLQPAVLGGLALYGFGAVVWLLVLAQWDVSKAYPLVGLGFVFTLAIGYLLGDHVTPGRLLGVILICSGVVLVARS